MSESAQVLAGLLNMPAGSITDAHIEKVAREVCHILGTVAHPRLQRKVQDWPQLAEEAEDLCQLAALAFIEAYRQGRIRPDEAAGRHTPESVLAYLWGICNRIFLQAVRRSQAHPLVASDAADAGTSTQQSSGLEELVSGGPQVDDESSLWEVLAAVKSRCRPEDVVVTWLHGCGFSIAELQQLLRISRNIPANAVKRVGQAVRELLGLDVGAKRPSAAITHKRNHILPRSETLLDLLLQGRFSELVELLANHTTREMLLHGAAARLGPPPGMAALSLEQGLAARQLSYRASGDWTWGLLSAKERRALLARDAALLRGAGTPDGGVAQKAAIERLVADMGNIFQELDQALAGDDLDWLLAIAEHLSPLLEIGGQFTEMCERYGDLLRAAKRLGSPRLEFLAQLGLARALWRLGDSAGAILAGQAARELAVELNDRQAEARSLYRLGGVERVQGHSRAAQELYGQALDIMRSLGDRCDEATCLNSIGLEEVGQGNLSAARELLGQALAIYRSLGNRLSESFSLCNLGRVEFYEGNFGPARELYAQALSVARGLGNRLAEAWSINGLAILEYTRSDFDAAREQCAQAHTIFRELGNRDNLAMSCTVCGAILAALGEFTMASQALYGALPYAGNLGLSECPACLAVRSDGFSRLDNAVTSGQISASELALWKSQGEGMNLDILAKLTLKALTAVGDQVGSTTRE